MNLPGKRALDLGAPIRLSKSPTLIHRLDPRAKLLVTLCYVSVVVSFDKYAIYPIVPFVIFPMAIGMLANIPLRYVAKRVALAIPFALAIGAANPLLDDQPILLLGTLEIARGWISYASLLLKVLLTVSATVMLLAVTSVQALCAALDALRVPRVFVVQLLFLFRYLFLLVGEASNMARARSLRVAGNRGMGPSVYGSLIGSLLLRTYDRAERIYLAMISRGYDRALPLQNALRFRGVDALFLLGTTALFFFMRTAPIQETLGKIVLEYLS